jgi:hypothetical protein
MDGIIPISLCHRNSLLHRFYLFIIVVLVLR